MINFQTALSRINMNYSM